MPDKDLIETLYVVLRKLGYLDTADAIVDCFRAHDGQLKALSARLDAHLTPAEAPPVEPKPRDSRTFLEACHEAHAVLDAAGVRPPGVFRLESRVAALAKERDEARKVLDGVDRVLTEAGFNIHEGVDQAQSVQQYVVARNAEVVRLEGKLAEATRGLGQVQKDRDFALREQAEAKLWATGKLAEIVTLQTELAALKAHGGPVAWMTQYEFWSPGKASWTPGRAVHTDKGDVGWMRNAAQYRNISDPLPLYAHPAPAAFDVANVIRNLAAAKLHTNPDHGMTRQLIDDAIAELPRVPALSGEARKLLDDMIATTRRDSAVATGRWLGHEFLRRFDALVAAEKGAGK